MDRRVVSGWTKEGGGVPHLLGRDYHRAPPDVSLSKLAFLPSPAWVSSPSRGRAGGQVFRGELGWKAERCNGMELDRTYA